MKIEYAKRAEIDLLEIYEFIAEDNAEAAFATIEHIETTLETIAKQPSIGKARNDLGKGLKAFIVGNYCAYYISKNSVLYIVRILHHAQDIERSFN
jgi:toxin ParE1/3/4